jgi:hypothetical protein
METFALIVPTFAVLAYTSPVLSYEFAVIEELENYTENSLALKLYANKKDTIGFYYFIGKNELKIKPKKKPNR